MKSVFVISKPLQYFNATNIPDVNDKIALISNSFKNADTFFEMVKKHSTYWDSVFLFNTNKEALQWLIDNKHNVDNIYLDADYGFSKHEILRKIKGKRIFVYEEGLGTYEPNLRLATTKNIVKNFTPFTKIKVKLFKYIYDVLGMKDHHGGNPHTEGLYLYDVARHKTAVPEFNKKRLSFKNSFVDHLVDFEDKFLLYKKDEELLKKTHGRTVVLYLSSWSIHSEIKALLTNYPDAIKIAKPHPQIEASAYTSFYNAGIDYIIQGENMVEFLIYDLLLSSQNLIVVHHNSAALQYLRNNKKLNEVIV